MAPLTTEDKIDFLMAVIRNMTDKPNIAAVAVSILSLSPSYTSTNLKIIQKEVGIHTAAASMRSLAIRPENEARLKALGKESVGG